MTVPVPRWPQEGMIHPVPCHAVPCLAAKDSASGSDRDIEGLIGQGYSPVWALVKPITAQPVNNHLTFPVATVPPIIISALSCDEYMFPHIVVRSTSPTNITDRNII